MKSSTNNGEAPQSPDDIDYELPPGVIAQTPLPVRDSARLLVDTSRGPDAPTSVDHHRVADLPELLNPGDVVVVNNTRVLPARLRLHRETGGATEVLLLEEQADGRWEALVRPSRKHAPGSTATAPGLRTIIGEDLGEGRRLVSLEYDGDSLLDALDRVGTMPLPPYIESPIDDPERYQTVFSQRPVSAAAPTAGLHLTDAVFAAFENCDISVATVELAVGLDTFRPVSVDRLDDHEMHSERYRVPAETQQAVRRAQAAGHRVVAIGTTSVRALEAWATSGADEGRTDIFIRRPYDWKVVDVLLTNFHLPRSTLLCLVDAFVGPRWRELYSIAIDDGYRFLSFGDAMLLNRQTGLQR